MSSGPNRPELMVEIPKFTRVLLCIPLRIGLIIWAILRIIAAISVFTFNVTDVYWFNEKVFVIMLWIANCLWLIDMAFSSLMVYGVGRRNCAIINITYSYCVAKVFLIPLMLITGGILLAIDPAWRWYRTFDVVTVYLFIDNIALGVVAWILHVYLTLLVRSQILVLGGTPKATSWFKLRCVDSEDPVLHGQNNAPSSDPQENHRRPPSYEEFNNISKYNNLVQPAV